MGATISVRLVVVGEEKEALPVSEKVRVLRSQTLFKSGRWWATVGLFEAFGRKHVPYTSGLGVEMFGGESRSLSSEAGKNGRKRKKP